MLLRGEALIDLLHDVDRGLHEHIKVVFSDLQIPFAGMMIIRKVSQEPGITVSELARKCRIVKSHVSKTIDELCHEGFVEKRPDSSDQRLVRVYATQLASDQLAELQARIRRRYAELIEPVPEEKQEALIDGLQVLQAALLHAKGPEANGHGSKR